MLGTKAKGYSTLELLIVLAVISSFVLILLSYSNNELAASDRKRMDVVADLLLTDSENYFRTNCNEFMTQAVALALGGVVSPAYTFQTVEEKNGTNEFYNYVNVSLVRSALTDLELQPEIAKRTLSELYNLSPSNASDPTEELNNWRVTIDFTNTVSFISPNVSYITDKAVSGLVQLELYVETAVPADYIGNSNSTLQSLFHADTVTADGDLRWQKKLRPTKISPYLQASRRTLGIEGDNHAACYF